MTSRYIYCPMTAKDISMKLTLRDRIGRWFNRKNRNEPDIYMVTGFFPPVWVRK